MFVRSTTKHFLQREKFYSSVFISSDMNNERRLRDVSLKTKVNWRSRCLFAIQGIAVANYILYYTF